MWLSLFGILGLIALCLIAVFLGWFRAIRDTVKGPYW
jgi:hypothetical protein